MEKITSVESLGSAIRAARKRLGLTQLELAEACNVGITFVTQLERGKATAELGRALRVAQAVGLDLFAGKRGE